jgi:GGDEF domain-containing protein
LKADTAAAKIINDSRKILRKLSSLEAIVPGNALLASTRETLAEKLSVATVASGKSSGDWDKALKEIKNIDSLFPKSAAIAAAQTEIQSEIESLRTNLKELATAKPDGSWSKNTTALLTKLTPLVPSSDPWLADMRNQLTDVYLAEAVELQASQRFTLAAQQLDRAKKINPDAASIKQGRESVKVALASFKSEQREQDTAARIAAHKQTFMGHIKSKQIASAKKTLELLRADLAGTDPFVKTEGPALLAEAYLEFATSKNSQKDYAAAIKFAESGSQYAPKDKQLLAALKTAKNGLANANQIRGRNVSENKWNDYNRKFDRCN